MMTLHSQSSGNRVMVFIDLANVNKCTESSIFRMDYLQLVDSLVKDRQRVAVYVFDSHEEPDVDTPLQNSLRRKGFRMRISNSVDPAKRIQKGVDVSLACMMQKQAYQNSYDVAILVSGDQDFVPVVQEIQELGKRVEIASFKESAGEMLIESGDDFIEIDTLPVLEMVSPAEISKEVI